MTVTAPEFLFLVGVESIYLAPDFTTKPMSFYTCVRALSIKSPLSTKVLHPENVQVGESVIRVELKLDTRFM